MIVVIIPIVVIVVIIVTGAKILGTGIAVIYTRIRFMRGNSCYRIADIICTRVAIIVIWHMRGYSGYCITDIIGTCIPIINI